MYNVSAGIWSHTVSTESDNMQLDVSGRHRAIPTAPTLITQTVSLSYYLICVELVQISLNPILMLIIKVILKHFINLFFITG